ncbi:uncharacterized protein LOC112521757 [Cynara cardunculus var. scolymus]|uniref:uncharacterized protein LOC112521757 n=1 Tax=Cynara cardunculus var. scolymus TaxID=59895 RepID=UPI000D62FB93|nr:uncharacterized protein LOC112521757 [Cynara cardunculus var. scolymus]
MRSKTSSQKKAVMIIWIFKTPIRALGKAKKFYVKGITNFSTTYNQPTMIINKPPLPRSFSTTTTMVSNDTQPSGVDLIRANSTSSIQIGRADVERYMIQHQQQQQQQQQLVAASRKRVPRSCSLGMGRIDEDRVSSFRNDNLNGSDNKLVAKDKDSRLSRNRSYESDSRRF